MEKPVSRTWAIPWWPGRKIQAVELEIMEHALEHFEGNKTRAAQAMGVTARKVRMWVRRHSQLARFRRSGAGRPGWWERPEHAEECD